MHSHRRGRSLFMLVVCTALMLPMFGSTATARDATGTVQVQVYACPEGVDPAADLETLTASCQESAAPVGMLITNGSGYFHLTGSITTEAVQQVTVETVPAGDIVITPQLPEEFGNANIYCAGVEGTPEAVALNLQGGAPWTLEADGTVSCQVIVFPVEAGAEAAASPVATPASLTVHVHGCPAGFEGTSAPELVEACTGHPISAVYISDLPDFYASDTTTGMAGDNSVTFADVPPATLDVLYKFPRSFTTLAVYCDQGSGEVDPSTWVTGSLISGTAIQVPVEAGAQVNCHWFTDAGDVEGDTPGNTLEIKAWNCPADFEAEGESWSGYLRACEEPSLDTSFTLTADAELPFTVSNDWYLWQGIPAGKVTLDATVPDGFGEPVIFCATNTGDVTRIERPIAPNGPLAMTFEQEDAHIRNCDWFNFPVAGSEASPVASENGSMEVTVYTCPAFTFVGPDECVIDDSGVEFSLLQWNGDPAVWAWEVASLVAVGGDGAITFDDLEAADYWPLANDAAWCHVESDALDVSGRWIDVEPGAVTKVSVYSCIAPEV